MLEAVEQHDPNTGGKVQNVINICRYPRKAIKALTSIHANKKEEQDTNPTYCKPIGNK